MCARKILCMWSAARADVSARLYATGLWWHTHHGGRAKLHGVERPLTGPPQLLDLDVAEIEYVPIVAVYRIREGRYGWRDMKRDPGHDEIKAADAFLRLLCVQGET